MNRTGKKSDAVPADLIPKVLASHANPGGAGGFQDIDIQVVPLLGVHRVNNRHRSQASTSVLLATAQEVKASQKPPSPSPTYGSPPAVAQRPHGLMGRPLGDGRQQFKIIASEANDSYSAGIGRARIYMFSPKYC